jgi:hypothetical protein
VEIPTWVFAPYAASGTNFESSVRVFQVESTGNPWGVSNQIFEFPSFDFSLFSTERKVDMTERKVPPVEDCWRH